MDLLACSDCEQRFYLPGVGPSDSRWCPERGGGLDLALQGMRSIPLDAHWLDARLGSGDAPQVTVVRLRSKRGRAGKAGKRIVRSLGDYFPVRAKGRSVKVSVNRGVPADAALRVAAVLDGVETGWEEHFYLPTADSEGPPRDLRWPLLAGRDHLRVVASNGNGDRPEQQA